MTESRIADSLPDWIKDHLRRYLEFLLPKESP